MRSQEQVPLRCHAPDVTFQDGGFIGGRKAEPSQVNNCVTIYPEGTGVYEGMMAVGDKKDPQGPVLAVSRTAMANFIEFAKTFNT